MPPKLFAARLARTDGSVEDVQVDLTDWKAITKAIGARWYEAVRSNDGEHRLLVDEEGLLTHKPVNPVASPMYAGWPNHPIVGDVLIVTEADYARSARDSEDD